MSRFMLFIILGLVIPCCGESDSMGKIHNDSIFNAENLKQNCPYLWNRVVRLMVVVYDKKAMNSLSLNMDSLVVLEIMKMTKGNKAKLIELNEKIYFEEIYIENKPDLDIARGKFVINPYLSNYFYFDNIHDPSPALQPRSGRMALKWQISIQSPILTFKYSNTGLFFAYTNRAQLDIFNGQDSRPVTHKTFLPEVFWRQDFASFLKKTGTDQITMQVGIQHESNGDMDDSSSLLDSRSIGYKLYGQLCTKFIKIEMDPGQRNLRNDQYALMLNMRLFNSYDMSDNPDIVKYIGNVEFNGILECVPRLRFGSFEKYFGVFIFDTFFAPGGESKLKYASYAIGLSWTPPMVSNKSKGYYILPKIPVSPYFRYFHGYNEFLTTYNKATTVWGFGVKLRG
jgi:outer membrane phospholipase A